MIRYLYLQLSLCLLLLCLAGCPGSNGDVGRVEGVVTLDGVPVKEAYVRFYPATARASSGKTDDEGHYELRYTRSIDGAFIGEHKVTISTEVEEDNYNPDDIVEGRSESIPKKYIDRKTTELTATVESGKNTIDFELTSGK